MVKPNLQQEELALPPLNVISILEKIILGGIVFILALPLLGDYGLWLFPLGRDVIFKLMVEFLVLVCLTLYMLKSRYTLYAIRYTKALFNPIALSLFAFWLVMIFSTLSSVQPDFSLWGNIYKNQGLITWTHYVLFFFLLITSLRNKNQWRILINTAIFIAMLVSLIALWQVLQGEIRAAATLNNSNYLAAYLILLLPLTFSIFLKKPSYFLGIATLLQFLALLATQTRGGYLGISAAIFVFTILYLKTGGLGVFKIFFRAGLPFLFLASCLSFLLFTSPGQSFQQKLPDSTDRFLSIQSIKGDARPRLEAWQAGWQGMLEKPILGYGPENFFVAYDSFYRGSFDHTGSLAADGSLWETWFDKAHNFIFDIGATTGFLGLLAYISIFASALYLLSKNLTIIKIGLIAAFGGYLAQSLLGFDTIVPGIYLMLLLAYAVFLAHKPAVRTTYNIQHAIYRIACLLGVIIFAVLFVASLKMHIDILKANHQLNLAESLARNIGVEPAFAAFEKGLGYNAAPVNPNLRRRYAVIALAYYDAVEKHCANSSVSADDNKARTVPANCEQLFADSEKYLIRALELSKENAAAEWPRFTRNYIYAAQISHTLGKYGESDEFFQKALNLSPNRASIYAEWSRILKERGETQRSDKKLEKAHSINPDIKTS